METCLLEACKFGRLAKVKEYLASSKHKANLNICDEYGNTPLILSSGNGHADVVTVLVKEGADVNVKNGLGATALHWACTYGNIKVVRILIDDTPTEPSLRIDKDAQNFIYGKTALMNAVTYNHREIVKFLIESGADKELKDAVRQID